MRAAVTSTASPALPCRAYRTVPIEVVRSTAD